VNTHIQKMKESRRAKSKKQNTVKEKQIVDCFFRNFWTCTKFWLCFLFCFCFGDMYSHWKHSHAYTLTPHRSLSIYFNFQNTHTHTYTKPPLPRKTQHQLMEQRADCQNYLLDHHYYSNSLRWPLIFPSTENCD
jgi:hypothetical protein